MSFYLRACCGSTLHIYMISDVTRHSFTDNRSGKLPKMLHAYGNLNILTQEPGGMRSRSTYITYLQTHLPTDSLTYRLTYLQTHLPTHLLTYIPTHLRIYSLTLLITYIFTYLYSLTYITYCTSSRKFISSCIWPATSCCVSASFLPFIVCRLAKSV